MTESIKRTDVMKICEEHIKRCFNSNDSYGQHAATKIFDDVVELPTADVVEVVRCKDCNKGFKRNEESRLNIYYCDKWKNIMRDCDFCSYGERK